MSLPLISGGIYDTSEVMAWVRVVVGLALLLALVVGMLRRSWQNDLRRTWTRVDGEVVAVRRKQPVVRYRTPAGETFVRRRPAGWEIVTPVVGKRVPVWIDPTDPQRFRTQVIGIDRHGSFCFVVAGLLTVLFLLVLLD